MKQSEKKAHTQKEQDTARRSDAGYMMLRHWAPVFSHLWRQMAGEEEDRFVSLSLRQRGGGDWVVVVKRECSDGGGCEVVFGNGYDLVTALMSANVGVGKGAWKPDKPFKPNGDGGGEG